jgi:hypothetical protein
MRFVRHALAAVGLTVAMLHGTGPALANATPTPVPAEVVPTAKPAPNDPAEPRPVPKGAPETGGGPGGSALVPVAGGILLAAGAGTGLLALRRRKHVQA